MLCDIASCGTEALGGQRSRCEVCGHEVWRFHPCRNRHCPKCHGADQKQWLEAQMEDLLPVPYFHVVFTVPHALAPLFLANRAAAFQLLFAAVAETLQRFTQNPRHLGAEVGILAILHTWTQTLLFHPHVHTVVTAGGLDPSGTRWVSARRSLFLPEQALAEVFRGALLGRLDQALRAGLISPPPGKNARKMLRAATRHRWVVDCRAPFAGPEHVFKYLSLYTHRIAISNGRLVALQDGRVTFRYKDRAHGDVLRTMPLDAGEFLHRFLLHVVPRGFVRIRRYGILANSVKGRLLPLARTLLAGTAKPTTTDDPPAGVALKEDSSDPARCPRCKTGRMVVIEEIAPLQRSIRFSRFRIPVRARAP